MDPPSRRRAAARRVSAASWRQTSDRTCRSPEVCRATRIGPPCLRRPPATGSNRPRPFHERRRRTAAVVHRRDRALARHLVVHHDREPAGVRLPERVPVGLTGAPTDEKVVGAEPSSGTIARAFGGTSNRSSPLPSPARRGHPCRPPSRQAASSSILPSDAPSCFGVAGRRGVDDPELLVLQNTICLDPGIQRYVSSKYVRSGHLDVRGDQDGLPPTAGTTARS